jgi:hypothetical protein
MNDANGKEIPEVGLNDIVEEVILGAEAHSAATKVFMSSFTFYEKTLAEWLNEMAVVIPDEIGPTDLRNLYIDVARKHQRAANYYTVASAIHGGLSFGGEIKKSDLVSAIVSSYTATQRKRPAATILERMADSYMNSTAHTKVAAKIVKDFWRERRDTLVEMRKCLEQVSISLHTEMKYQE